MKLEDARGGAGGSAPPAAKDAGLNAAGEYLARLTKLIPVEVLVIFPLARTLTSDPTTLRAWSLICLVLVLIFRFKLTKDASGDTQWAAVIISAVSFIFWVHTLGEQFSFVTYPPDPDGTIKTRFILASAAWSTVVPILYTGDKQP